MSTIRHLDRFLAPITQAFTPQMARTILELRADAEHQAQVGM